jgi:nicotinate-nucleotide adenylyltransferase
LGLKLKRVGILGGAFDPPHLAHVAMAMAAIEQYQLDELRIIPTGDAWHKPRNLSPGAVRLEMARLAFADLQGAVVDDIEIKRQGPSFTFETLRALQSQFPESQFFLFVGEDQGKALGTWREIVEIAQRAIICVAERETPEPTGPDAPTHDIPTQTLKLPPLPHSATEVRTRVAHGQPIDALVPKAVALYIDSHHLYQLAR